MFAKAGCPSAPPNDSYAIYMQACEIRRFGSRVVTADADEVIKIWNAATGQELLSFESSGAIADIAIAPDGATLVVVQGRELVFWDTDTGQVVGEIDRISDASFTDAAYSPDGNYLITGRRFGFEEELATIWDIEAGRPVAFLRGHEDFAIAVDWSSGAEGVVATGSDDFTGFVWDVSDVIEQ